MEYFKKLFEGDFMPHGHCYFWDPAIVWTNAISNSLIALAYFTIPFTLIYIVRNRKDIYFSPLIILFAMFILSCGATHIMDVVNIWSPFYRLDSSFRVITAVASMGTAFMLVKISPEILSIPNSDLHKKLNEELKEQIIRLKDQDQTIELLKKNKEIQDAMTESEGRFKLIFDNSLAAIVVTDDQGNYLSVNKAASDLFHYPVNELLQMNEVALKTTATPEAAKSHEEYASKGEEAGEFDLITKNGAHKFVKYHATRLKSDFNLSIMMDITEQKESELKLKASEEKYRGLFETMDQGFSIIEMIFDSDKKPVDCVYIETNPVFEKQTGLKNVIGKTAREMIPDLEEHWFQIYGKVALTGESQRFIEGSEALGRWFETYTFRLGDQGSNKVAVLFTDITERKQNEETLRYRKALLEAHNEANRDGLLLVDAKGKIISYNQSFIDLWRMPQGIVDDKDDDLALAFAMSQLVNPQQFIDKVKWLYEHPSETSIDELEYLDGRIIERHGYSVLGEDGTYYAWSWTFRDITEQKAAAAAISESEVRFRTMAEATEVLIGVADESSNASYFNKAWVDLTGRPMEDLLKLGWADLLHPDDKDRVVDVYLSAFVKQEGYTLEFRVLNKDGEYRWLLAKVPARFHPDGTFAGYISASVDITDQKTFTEELEKQVAERTEELRIKNQTFEIAETIAKLGSYKWNIATGSLEYSDNLFLLFDYEPGEFEPSFEKFLSFIHPDDLQQVMKNGEETVKTGRLVETPYRIISKTGKIKYLRSTGSFTGEDDNRMLIGTVQDISKDIAAAEALRSKNIELENSNAQLKSFNYITSHDLQEPLRKIQVFGRRIMEVEAFSGKTQDYFNRLIETSERMQNLIVSLLDFSRLSEIEIIFEPCDLNGIIEESKDDLHLFIAEKQAVVQYENLPTIMASRIQLIQLFTNLIDNAIKYCRPEIQPHIKITASMLEGKSIKHPLVNNEKKYHKIEITDNGIGFEQEYSTKIFEIFQRLHGKKEYSGTGIGLAIVKKIVTIHNGFVTAESMLDRGSTFTLYLPTK